MLHHKTAYAETLSEIDLEKWIRSRRTPLVVGAVLSTSVECLVGSLIGFARGASTRLGSQGEIPEIGCVLAAAIHGNKVRDGSHVYLAIDHNRGTAFGKI